jgi:hypothetical protein
MRSAAAKIGIRLHFGYFEGIDSERGIACRAADSFALRGSKARSLMSRSIAYQRTSAGTPLSVPAFYVRTVSDTP